MQTVQPTAVRPHIVWLDVLRLIAILLVIAVHCTDPFNASPESRADPEFNFWGSVYGSALRACVPLFVMMTGFLLLPVKQTMPAFYRKRSLPDLVGLVRPCALVHTGGGRKCGTGDALLSVGTQPFGVVR